MADRALTYKIGDLVRWFEPYADGVMTRDAGKGIVLRIHKYSLQLKSEDESYTTYEVYRNKHQDKMVFEARELEKINE